VRHRIVVIICHIRRTAGPLAYPPLPEDHVRREEGKAFDDKLEDTDTKIQLSLGGKKTTKEIFTEALLLQDVFQAGRLPTQAPGHSGKPITTNRARNN
jgi:hypothetical protein